MKLAYVRFNNTDLRVLPEDERELFEAVVAGMMENYLTGGEKFNIFAYLSSPAQFFVPGDTVLPGCLGTIDVRVDRNFAKERGDMTAMEKASPHDTVLFEVVPMGQGGLDAIELERGRWRFAYRLEFDPYATGGVE